MEKNSSNKRKLENISSGSNNNDNDEYDENKVGVVTILDRPCRFFIVYYYYV
jgi:hypothetical protein